MSGFLISFSAKKKKTKTAVKYYQFFPRVRDSTDCIIVRQKTSTLTKSRALSNDSLGILIKLKCYFYYQHVNLIALKLQLASSNNPTTKFLERERLKLFKVSCHSQVEMILLEMSSQLHFLVTIRANGIASVKSSGKGPKTVRSVFASKL